jgi:nitrate reductase NapAB chaperone NapD
MQGAAGQDGRRTQVETRQERGRIKVVIESEDYQAETVKYHLLQNEVGVGGLKRLE